MAFYYDELSTNFPMLIPANEKFVRFIDSKNSPVIRGFTTKSLHLRGFTLIELLIVIAILGILAAAVLVAANPGKRTKQARDSARKNDIGSIATALQAYYITPGQGRYAAMGASQCGSDSGLTTLTSQGDLKNVPRDPQNNYYCYTTNAATTESAAYQTLEQPTSSPGTYVWCWASTSGKALEITTGQCTP